MNQNVEEEIDQMQNRGDRQEDKNELNDSLLTQFPKI
jgi:hypothetical protein